jgi:hypothetical protein
MTKGYIENKPFGHLLYILNHLYGDGEPYPDGIPSILLAQSGFVLLPDRASTMTVFDALVAILISFSLLCFFLFSAHLIISNCVLDILNIRSQAHSCQ